MGTFNEGIDVQVHQGELKNITIKLNSQNGAIISGTVTFPDGITPVYNATVLLSYLYNGILNPITFSFTDIHGNFIFGIKNTSLDYHITVVYNEPTNQIVSP